MSIVVAIILAMALVLACVGLHDAKENFKELKSENDKLVACKAKTDAKVSQDSIVALLDEKGVVYELIDSDRLSFYTEETMIIVDCSQAPRLKISCGVGLKTVNSDWSCISKAANEVEENLIMVKPYGSKDDFVEFYIMCMEHSIGHLTKSLDDYVSILSTAHKQFVTKYNEYKDKAQAERAEKRYDPTQMMIEAAEGKAANRAREIEEDAAENRSRKSLAS